MPTSTSTSESTSKPVYRPASAIRSTRTRRIFTLLLLVCLAVSLICVVYPLYVIRPFRAQGARELAAALMIERFEATITLVSMVAALAALLWYWPSEPRTRRRALAAVGAGFVCVLAALARVNVYELRFHAIDHASYAAASRVKLDKDEQVLAVKIGASTRAYPIRSLSYHHMVNDVMDTVAIVATY
jgi:uncharacterized BrkB/YihY/UPF0761 family membrane protein